MKVDQNVSYNTFNVSVIGFQRILTYGIGSAKHTRTVRDSASLFIAAFVDMAEN